MLMDEGSERRRGNMRFFTEFLDQDFGQGSYSLKVQNMVEQNKNRLTINLDDLRLFDNQVAERFLRDPNDFLPDWRDALKTYASSFAPSSSEDSYGKSSSSSSSSSISSSAASVLGEYHIAVEGSFGARRVTPRGLTCHLLRSLVCLEGIITKCSLVRPKVVVSTHYCPATNEFHQRRYEDALSAAASSSSSSSSLASVGLATPSSFPTTDPNGNPLVTEFGLSVFRDHQTLTVQEMPERAPAGQLPRSVDVILEDDLVDRVKPGDRVQIVGIFRPMPHGTSPGTSTVAGIYRTVLVGLNVRMLDKENRGPKITDSDIRNIKKVALELGAGEAELEEEEEEEGEEEEVRLRRRGGGEDEEGQAGEAMDLEGEEGTRRGTGRGRRGGGECRLFEQLAGSLAPSIYGHEWIKKAILLLLLGGVEKNLENGTHLRGDINVMLVGDPSTAKSQMLRFCMNIAPLCISTSGRGTTGVGLTAAVTTDSDSGERRLEAGAMVLADRGVCTIDEFDKMSEEDRVAVHEVMEQQTVTIAKAGVHVQLNARCSVLAAANPIYGRYDRSKRPLENIALPDSLLSRFDLLFVVLDELTPEHDRSIADHVLKMHQYIQERTGDGEDEGEDGGGGGSNDEEEEEEEGEEESVFAKRSFGVFKVAFIKKFILYAKSRCKPTLTQAAVSCLAEAYANLRSKEDVKTLPVTARTFETMVRLATAHAKCRLGRKVTKRDTHVALELMNYALYHEATPVPVSRTRSQNSQQQQQQQQQQQRGRRAEEQEEQEQDENQAPSSSSQNIRRGDEGEEEEEEDKPLVKRRRGVDELLTSAPSSAPSSTSASRDRVAIFSKALSGVFKEKRASELPLGVLLQEINKKTGGHFDKLEFDQIIEELVKAEQVMCASEVVYLMS